MKVLHSIWFTVFIIGISISLCGINTPYTGLYNANNNYAALASKNFLKFGFIKLNFLPTYYVGQMLPDPIPYYLHHPTLMFLFEALPYKLFGSSHWVVHVAPFVFVLGSLAALFLLVRELTDERIAKWTVVFALLFPMMSFFWKYILFEQASLFVSLMVIWLCVRYWKKGHPQLLLYITAASFFGGAIDWYGAYIFFGLLYVLCIRRNARVVRSFAAYAIGALLGLGTYGAALYLTGNLHAAWEGYSARGLTSELTRLSFWPARLMVITILRIFLYGSPLVFFGIWHWYRTIKKSGVCVRAVQSILLIIGTVSIFVLPSTVWGHSYFLYYLVPFLAFVTSVWFVRVWNTSPRLAVVCLLIQIIWSMGVQCGKLYQVQKHTWKYAFGADIAGLIPAYSTIGVVEYPGDVLQNYYSIQTESFNSSFVDAWSKDASHSSIRYIAVTCSNTACNTNETQFLERIKRRVYVHTFHYQDNTGWVLDAGMRPDMPEAGHMQELPYKPYRRPQGVLSPAEWLYRKIRDFLGSTQI